LLIAGKYGPAPENVVNAHARVTASRKSVAPRVEVEFASIQSRRYRCPIHMPFPSYGIRRRLKALRRQLLRGIYEILRFAGRKTLRLGPPIGTFRGLDSPDAHLVLAGQEIRPPGARSLRVLCHLNQHGRQPWPIFWRRFPQARLVGSSLALLDSKKRLMVESVFGEEYSRTDPSYNYNILPPARFLPGPWTSLVSFWCSRAHYQFYHWITDGLPRLALLDRFPAETRILIPAESRPYITESLEMLGLSDRCRPTSETHLQIEDYYFSSPITMTGTDNPYAIHFLRSKLLGKAAPWSSPSEKIYITRRNGSRSAIQEEEIIDLLSGRGWTIVEAEKHSLREQIALFSQARSICAIHGAALTNLIWCRKGCKVLELCAASYLNGCYEGIAAYLDLDYRFMIFDADSRFRLKVDLDEFKRAVAELD
jgi:hypothetical protein